MLDFAFRVCSRGESQTSAVQEAEVFFICSV